MSFFTTYSFLDVFWLSVCPDCFSKINAKVIAVAHQVPELPVMPPGIESAGLCNWASRADACPGEHVPV